MNEKDWFEEFKKSKHCAFLQKKPIAYFCIEYALSDSLPTYAGGLGVLAGDYVKELRDQDIPSVAVGLYYQSKYGIDNPLNSGQPFPIALTPQQQGLTAVVDKEGKQVLIQVPIHDHDVTVKAWLWQNGTIPVYLLDTNVEENDPQDRAIGFKLYDSTKEVRLKQEMILGIGGFRLLERLSIAPSIYHMNEGHSVFLGLEIIRHEMQKRKLGFHDAIKSATHHVVFTNHTLLAAGNEVYRNELFTLMVNRYATELEIPVADIVELGTVLGSNNFSLSLCSMRIAGKINAVSKLHAREAQKTWGTVSVESVTNGIYLKNWDRIQNPSNPVGRQEETKDLLKSHLQNKKELLRQIKKRTGQDWGEDVFLIGWARRIVRYKRPLAIFGDIKQFAELAHNAQRPMRMVIAGVAHHGDNEGQEILQVLQQMIKKELSDVAVYLPDYNTTLSGIMTSGSDIWLNTPVVGSEACGTSGMKAALNGTLACTTKDGWMDEVDVTEIGWALDSDVIHDSVMNVLKSEVLPLFYDNKPAWEGMMHNARVLVQNNFSSTRMLKDYFEKIYLPILTSSYAHYLS